MVTEYAWQATSCDPCPTAPLTDADMLTFGSDVLAPAKERDMYNPASGFVLTRLHARYDKSSLGEDLVFRAAKGIEGGREHDREAEGLRQTAVDSDFNNFQGRYAIRYPWKGEVKCDNPLWGQWGGNPEGGKDVVAARDTAFQRRDPELLAKLAEADVPVFEVKGRKRLSGVAFRGAAPEVKPEAPAPSPMPAPAPATKRWWEFWK